jgi:hypothetical protein
VGAAAILNPQSSILNPHNPMIALVAPADLNHIACTLKENLIQ